MGSTLTPAQQRIVDTYVAAERAYRRDRSTHANLVLARAAARQAGVLGDSIDACTDDRVRRGERPCSCPCNCGRYTTRRSCEGCLSDAHGSGALSA